MTETSPLQSFWLSFEGRSLAIYHRILSGTCRWQVNGRENITLAESSKRPLLWVFWHGQLSPMVTFLNRFYDPRNIVMVTIGGDERGQILQQFARSLHASPHAVDMSGNPMAAGRAVLRIIQEMKAGKHSFIAPDGPDGPPFEPKPGALFLAKKARAALIPVGAYARPAYNLRRWDKYNIPLPFSRIQLEVGPPIFVDKAVDEEQLSSQLSDTLSTLYARARA